MNSLTVSGKLESLTEIAQYIIAVATDAKLERKAAYGLRLAVDEIATNIILHGYEESGKEGNLEVQIELNSDNLTVLIEDTAVLYNPTMQAIPDDLAKPPQERHIGGLGVYLAIQGVDKFSYERIGNRNRNVFVMNRIKDNSR